MPHVLALDQGTTSSRAIVFDEAGRQRSLAQREFRQIFPKGGWVEHDPAEIWATQRDVAREAIAAAGLRPGDIAAIGITNQRETAVVWDRRSGEPVHNAIVWQDRRTSGFCDDLRRAGYAELIQRKTGLPIDAYFSGSKVRWILDNVPGARARAERGELAFGTVDSWLIWNLTGGRMHATDVSNASRTMLLGIERCEWDDELLALLGVPRAMLPEVRASSGVIAAADPEVLGAAIPIAGVAGDQQSALFGQACFAPGLAKNTYGTGCFALMNIGERPIQSGSRLITTVAWRVGERTEYALEGSVFIGGAVVQWLRDGLGLIKSAGEIEALAASVPDTGGVYFVPAFAGLGAPYWDQYARGAILGLTRGTTAAHLARAALESIAFQVADVLDAMRDDTSIPLPQLRVDGGAAANDLLLRFQADLLGIPVVRPKVTETTALGTAYLAGLAVGVWSDRDRLASQWQIDRVFEPTGDRERMLERRRRWREAVRRAAAWEPGSPTD